MLRAQWTCLSRQYYYLPIMASERVQRRIERLLDQIEQESDQENWQRVLDLVEQVLGFDSGNRDAAAFKSVAERRLSSTDADPHESIPSGTILSPSETFHAMVQPTSFADGRYQVKKFLGEGGKKRVYLAHDTLLDREVAFALIKTEGLDETSRTRIQREAQAMGRLGSHPHIVTVFDLGQEQDQPYMVTELSSALGSSETREQLKEDVEALMQELGELDGRIDRALRMGIALPNYQDRMEREIRRIEERQFQAQAELADTTAVLDRLTESEANVSRIDVAIDRFRERLPGASDQEWRQFLLELGVSLCWRETSALGYGW